MNDIIDIFGFNESSIMATMDRIQNQDLTTREFGLKKWILILSALSLLAYMAIDLLEIINRANGLPFGFRYSVLTADQTLNGKLPSLTPAATRQRIFNKLPANSPAKSLTFWTVIHSPVEKSYRYFLPEIKKVQLYCNGTRIKISPDGFRKQIRLNRGFNEIEIHYQQVKANPQLFRFFLRFSTRKGVASRPLPFYHSVLPDSSISKALFQGIRFLDSVKPAGFLLALILVLYMLTAIVVKFRKPPALPLSGLSLALLVFEFFCLWLGLIFSITFLKNRLNVVLANELIWAFSLLLALLVLLKSLKDGKITFKPDKEKILVIFLISVVVFGYLYWISGQWLPLEPVGAGDLRNHMVMVHHYQQFNEIKTDEFRMVYPQSLHAFIAVLSRWLGTPPETIITLFLALVFILVYFLIYLLSKHFFPDLNPVFFLTALLLMNFTFVLDTGFKFHYFPPLVSTFFFLSSLLFFLKNRLPVSSLLLAVSIIVYPYYVIIFTLTLFCLFLVNFPVEGARIGLIIRRLFIYFLLPLFFIVIYIFIYNTYGFPQHQQGFVTFAKLIPFSALKPVNTFLILLGIYYLISRPGKNRGLHVLIFSTVIGFLIYYIPYYFFNLGSSYYLIKNILYLVLMGIILESLALQELALGLKRKLGLKTIRKNRSTD